MKNKADVITIPSKYIEAGISKYGGVVDGHLESLIKSAELQYTPYLFKDGRILLVLPNKVAAFLYKDKETLFETLSLIP